MPTVKQWSRERIVADLRRWIAEHGRTPSLEEWVVYPGTPSVRTVYNNGGSWASVVAAAGGEVLTAGHSQALREFRQDLEAVDERATALGYLRGDLVRLSLKRILREDDAALRAGLAELPRDGRNTGGKSIAANAGFPGVHVRKAARLDDTETDRESPLRRSEREKANRTPGT